MCTWQHIQEDLKMEFICELGQGSFGHVIRTRSLLKQKDYAVKVFKKEELKLHSIEEIKLEAKILKNLKHKNIIKFKKIVETSQKLYIVMKLAPSGTLHQLIQ